MIESGSACGVVRVTRCSKCKVLTLHGLLTRHVAHARAQYRCHMAVHTASTLEVQHRPHSELEFGVQSEINITTGFGSKSKTATYNTYYYFEGLFFAVGASPVPLRTLVVLCYLLLSFKHGPNCGFV